MRPLMDIFYNDPHMQLSSCCYYMLLLLLLLLLLPRLLLQSDFSTPLLSIYASSD